MSEITDFFRQLDRDLAPPEAVVAEGPARAGSGRVAELCPAFAWPDISPTSATQISFNRMETLVHECHRVPDAVDFGSNCATEPSHTAITVNPLFEHELVTLDDSHFTLVES